MLAIGLMMDTSLDGVDVALVDLDNGYNLKALTYPYSDDLRSQFEIYLITVLLFKVCSLNFELGYVL